MNVDMAVQILRYLLIAIGTVLTTKGLATEGEVQTVVGAVIGAAPVVWGVYTRWHTKAVPAVTAAKPTVPTVSQVTGQVQK